MKEQKFDVKPVKIEAVCDCGGIYKMNPNVVLAIYPPQYSYQCNKCGKTTTSTEIYPKILHEKIEERNNKRTYMPDDLNFTYFLNRIYGSELPSSDKILETFCLLYSSEDNERGILVKAIKDFAEKYENLKEEYQKLSEQCNALKEECQNLKNKIAKQPKDWRLI